MGYGEGRNQRTTSAGVAVAGEGGSGVETGEAAVVLWYAGTNLGWGKWRGDCGVGGEDS